MIRYIIHLKDGTNSYYAGDDKRVTNRWTSSAALATRWLSRDSAVTFVTSIRSILNPRGELHVREIQVPEMK